MKPTVLDTLRQKNPLPHGTVLVGGGLAANGITMFAFLFASKRVLSEDAYSVLGVLWGLVFLVGPGFFLPLEQEVSRALASRRSRGVGALPLIKRAAMLGAGLAGVLVIVTAVFAGPLSDEVFRGDLLFVAAFTLSFVCYGVELLVRGVLSGTGRFSTYAVVLGLEGVSRFVLAMVLVVAGVKTAGMFGLALAVGPILAASYALTPKARPHLVDGPPASTSELSTSLGWLLMGSVLTLGLMNIGPALVESFGGEAEPALPGRFLNALLVARIPLFLFQAVQAALLPAMADHAGAGRFVEFRTAMKQLMVAVTGVAAVGLIGSFALGPLVAKILLGEMEPLGRLHFVLLALSMALYMGALALAQALIALHHQRQVAMLWGVAALAFLGGLFASSDALLRVELALLVGAVVAALGLLTLLRADRRWSEARSGTQVAPL